MPWYDFQCGECNQVFERKRPMVQSGDPAFCFCGGASKRLYSRPQISLNHWIPDPREMNGEKEFIAAGGYE